MSKKDSQKASLLRSANLVNILTLTVVTIACVVLVLFLSKRLFSSNNKDIPATLNTATLAAAAPAAVTDVTASGTVTAKASASASEVSSQTETAASETTAAVDNSVGYVVTYVQLKAKPDQESENLMCMSPNLKVKIMERRDDGYIYLTFLNGDGTTYTGYVKQEYISPTEVERTTAAATTAAEAETTTEIPVQTTTTVSHVLLIETQSSTRQTLPPEMTFATAPQ